MAALDKEPAYPVAEKLNKSLEVFHEYVPLLVHLRNPGLRVRHWKALSASLKAELGPGMIYAKKEEMKLTKHRC